MKKIWLLCLLFSAPAFAKFQVPGFELVYSAPVGTTLAASDLRNPAEVWKELIDGAKRKIDFEQMYVNNDAKESLEVVVVALEAAGKRGVKTRFLIEEKTLYASDQATIERLRKIDNLELRILAFRKVSAGGILHAKFFVVDGKIAYMGSQNFDWRSLTHVHETGLNVSHAVIVRQLQSIFDHDWLAWQKVEQGKKMPELNQKSIAVKPAERAYLVASPNAFNPRGVANSEAELPRLLSEAKEEIRIQVMEYSPLEQAGNYYPIFDNALRSAQARHVKIKLLVSNWGQDKPAIDHLKSLAVLPDVEVKIITIPPAKSGPVPFGRVLHSKTLTIDGKIAWVGTSNWEGGYMDYSRNVELVIRDAKMAQRLARLQDDAWNSEYAEKIDLAKEYPTPNKAAL